MKIGDRFVDYAVTGAFFILTQWAVFLAVQGGLGSWNEIGRALDDLPDPVTDGINSGVVSALGIMAIFLFGLLLDLFGSTFALREVEEFQRHVSANSEWLTPVLSRHSAFTAASVHAVTGTLVKGDQRSIRDKAVAARSHERLQSFLLAFIHTFAGSSDIPRLSDSVHLWRTSRAIATTMIVVGVEVAFVSFTIEESNFLSIAGSYILAILVVSVAILMSDRAYRRFCYDLFALVYTSQCKIGLDQPSAQRPTTVLGSTAGTEGRVED